VVFSESRTPRSFLAEPETSRRVRFGFTVITAERVLQAGDRMFREDSQGTS
jgi:hypothetical protein